MTRRLTIALMGILMLAGPALAQPGEEIVPEPRRRGDAGPLSGLMALPTGWSMPSADGRFWASVDYQLVFMDGMSLPPLLTTSPAGTNRLNAGVLGNTDTTTLFGDARVNDGLRSGVRVQTGGWFDAERTLGIEAGVIVIEGQAAGITAASDGTPILARPFGNTVTGLAASQVIAFPGVANGSIDFRAQSANFYEFHIDLTEKAIDDGWYRLYSMFGYRFYRYDERLTARSVINPTEAGFVPGTQIITSDNIHARNEFHGIDLGLRSQFVWDSLSLDVLTKLAIGRVNRSVNIGGDQLVTVPGAAPVAQGGGFLASSTNSGIAGSGDWKVMPEVGATLNWQVRPNLSLRFGYTFMLLNGINRAGDKVDTFVNPNFLTAGNPALGGALQPASNNTRADMWIQAINLGLLFTY